jgi:aminoglycoside 9-adenylyltransferase
VEPVVKRLHDYLEQTYPDDLLGVYLFGSAAVGGLRPESDIDLVFVRQSSLSQRHRQGLVEFLLQFSGSRATVAQGRPLEVTALVLDDVVPWRYPPVCDFLYGEWLRDEYLDGRLPQRDINPDLGVLITTLRQHARCLRGPRPSDLLEPVPLEDLHRAIQDSLPSLLDGLVGDERNVLLTLARMVVTLETGLILPKDEAEALIAPSLPEPHRSWLSLASRGYMGDTVDDWTNCRQGAADAAEHLAERIRTRRREP